MTCLDQLIDDQARRQPSVVAVVADGEQLTHEALNRRANQLAHHLIACGVGPETPVAVCLTRSPALIVALLAVLSPAERTSPSIRCIPRNGFDTLWTSPERQS